VLRSRLSFRRFKRERCAITSFGSIAEAAGGLTAGIDELFDYWGSERIKIRQLTGYLNRFGFTAVTTQMLDGRQWEAAKVPKCHPADRGLMQPLLGGVLQIVWDRTTAASGEP